MRQIELKIGLSQMHPAKYGLMRIFCILALNFGFKLYEFMNDGLSWFAKKLYLSSIFSKNLSVLCICHDFYVHLQKQA